MEALAVRPPDAYPSDHEHEHEHEQQLLATDPVDELSALPAPPEPFPVHLLAPSLSISSQPPAVPAVEPPMIAQTQHDLQALQRSSVAALSSLLPVDTASSPPTVLFPPEQRLAAALTELLEVSYELESFRPSPAYVESERDTVSANTASPDDVDVDVDASFAALREHLMVLQSSAAQRTPGDYAYSANASGAARIHPAINVVREELAWARVETLAHAVLEMIRDRADGREHGEGMISVGSDLNGIYEMPPRYSFDGVTNHDPPGYEHEAYAVDHKQTFESEKEESHSHPEASSSTRGPGEPASGEKMLGELDAVTDAIERLAHIAPRLQNQRVELRQATAVSTSTLTSASTSAAQEQASGGTKEMSEKEKMRELEEIWAKIEKAHGKRRIRDGQRADREGWEQRRLARRERFLENLYDQSEGSRFRGQDSVRRAVDVDLAKARELRDRDHFLRDLIEQSAGGRLESQDAEAPADEMDLLQRRQAFLTDLVERTRAGRLDQQDYPSATPIETRVIEQRQSLINSIVEYSSSRRLRDQDFLPPTPRAHDRTHDPHELVTMQDFFRTTTPPVSMVRNRSSSGSATSTEEKGSRSRSNSTGALQKIATMVRRGSQGLGLKATVPSFDSTSISYVAEHQENLQVVQVMLHGMGISLKEDLVLQTPSSASGSVDEAIVSRKDTVLRIPLPTAVHAGQSITLSAQDLHYEARLSALPAPTSSVTSLNTVLATALSASELRSRSPSALCCTACEREIADVSAASRSGRTGTGAGYKDLPSEHWAEMMEVWMCHSDPAFTSQLAKRTEEGFWPAQGGVLVGGSYVLVNKDDVKWSSLHFEDIREGQWRVVACQCGEVLGKHKVEDGKKGEGTVRFAKWSIALLRNEPEGETVEPVRYPLSVFVISDMLELAQAHASYRFVISDEETDEKKLAIWLFNPSVRISYRKATSSSPLPSPLRATFTDRRDSLPSARSRRSSINASISLASGSMAMARNIRAAKIFYKVLGTNVEIDKLPGFGARAQVESISYSSDVCARLIAALRESTSAYPPSRRAMGVFDAGFLERC